MSFDNLKGVLEELADLRAEIKVKQERADELGKAVKSAISGQVQDTIVGNVVFSLRVNAGRSSFDWEAMKADGIDIEPYRKQGAPVSTLTVKRVNTLD